MFTNKLGYDLRLFSNSGCFCPTLVQGMRVYHYGTSHDGKDITSVMLTLMPCIVKKEGGVGKRLPVYGG